ncbi:ABC transporter ATP-binding protein [Acidaminobacterium chupaoyuni]
MDGTILLKAEHLKKYFPVSHFLGGGKRMLKAVDDVSLEIFKGETFGLVGESGCGKSTLGRSLIRMYDITGGTITYDGDDISLLKGKKLEDYHKRMQIIFQDPYSALNPYWNVKEILREPLQKAGMNEKDQLERMKYLLGKVGMKPEDLEKFPYEFSGGQRQRIGIARALSVDPEFVMCDEPISALDVSIQAQVVNMLEDLQQEMHLTYLFAAHDLSMVKYISHRIGVMYLGNLVEVAPCGPLYERPLHPYTQALLSAIPVADPRAAQASGRMILKGELPSPMHVPQGCHFSPRCPYANERCRKEKPTAQEAETGHWVSCFRYAEING